MQKPFKKDKIPLKFAKTEHVILILCHFQKCLKFFNVALFHGKL